MKFRYLLCSLLIPAVLGAQQVATPEFLWQLGKVSGMGVTADGKVIYSVQRVDIPANSSSRKYYSVPVTGGSPTEISNAVQQLPDRSVSPGGKMKIGIREVKVLPVAGTDYYKDLQKSNLMIYDDLNYRHWDTWEDGLFDHVFLFRSATDSIDLMPGEPHDSPQKPFGGDEDYLWSPDGRSVLYVTKKKYGKAYALSTNTDIYSYDIQTGTTTNLTAGLQGYDINPAYSSKGVLAWLSMKTDGFESDKNDIFIMHAGARVNLTQSWDGTVNSFRWSNDGSRLYFTAPVDGTIQLFEVENSLESKKLPKVRQITNGVFDVNDLVGESGNSMVVARTDMNHSAELYVVNLTDGTMEQLTHVNDEAYKNIRPSRVEKRMTTTSDGKQMLSWVIYPPDFDPSKKYPTLLYCQGGPKSALTQFYSTRWNFQLMAANGYIVIAPNRRGMPGHGVKWNADISKDYGGQVMRDYLAAIDDLSREAFVDKNRIGCVGASFGGYSVFYLAGNHQKRFRSFISHDGIFDWRSMYGTTEEMFFVNWDLGGPYWDKTNLQAQKAYNQFNPVNYVEKWDTPILIIQGGKDYRVPPEQGLAAFQAAQLRGIKSRLLYLPEENHWVLKAQNSIAWHREFYRWLKETL